MTLLEKKLVEQLRKVREENAHIRAGAKEISQAVDAVMIATALAYGARLPDGGMVLSMDRPAVSLVKAYRVKSRTDKRGRIRVEVREKA